MENLTEAVYAATTKIYQQTQAGTQAEPEDTSGSETMDADFEVKDE
jgi:hypothetical protein